jgi:hypothetical protein
MNTAKQTKKATKVIKQKKVTKPKLDVKEIDPSVPTTPFSLEEAIRIFESSKKIVNNKIETDITVVCAYICKYFFPLKDSCYAFYDKEDSKVTILDHKTIKVVYFNKLDVKISDWFFKKYTMIFSISSKIGGNFVENNTINLCGKFKYRYKKYDTFSENIKKNVEVMKDYFKNIWCSGKQDTYEYVMKWISNMMKGNKNTTFLYLRGEEGIGKSRGTDFIRGCIGDELSLESNSVPLRSRFNKILLGKLFVYFEELEKCSEYEWEMISSSLKRLSTSEKMVYEDKNEKAFTSDNNSNNIINTNRESVKDSTGRRAFPVPVSSSKKGDHEYWDDLHKKCFNNDVYHAFYCNMLEMDTDKFNPQIIPHSDIKEELLNERLHVVYKFIKFEYIYKNKDLKTTVKDLYEEFETYCIKKDVEKKFISTKTKFTSKLRDVGIDYKCSNGKTIYRMTIEDLRVIAKRFSWLSIHDNDELDEEVEDKSKEIYDDTPVIEKEYKKKLEEKDKEIERLKAEIESLKLLVSKQKEDNEEDNEEKVKVIKAKKKVKQASQPKKVEEKEKAKVIFDLF